MLDRRSAAEERWMSCLPTMLRACAEANDEASAEKVLSAMSHAGSRQHQSFLAHFNEILTRQFLDASFLRTFSSKFHERFVDTFSWVTSLNFDVIRELSQRCVDGTFSPAVVRRLLGILLYRYETTKNEEKMDLDETLFLYLLTTIMLRGTKSTMNAVESQCSDEAAADCSLYVVCSGEFATSCSRDWPNQQQLIDYVCEVVGTMSDRRRTLSLFGAYIKHILSGYSVLSLLTALSACRVLSRMSELDRRLTTDELSSYVVPLIGSLLQCVERLGEMKRSLTDDVDAVERLTSCETSLAVECRRLLHCTRTRVTLLDTDSVDTTLVTNFVAAAD